MRFRPVHVGVSVGRYDIVSELGTGGMATVYRARDTELRRDIAIKVLFPHLCKKREVVARFQREARAAASLDHPHILRVHDVGGGPESGPTEPGAGDGQPIAVDPPYMVLELVRGQNLREFVTGHGIISAEIVAAIGVVMCSALTQAHRAGIIHRDIKPANIMVADGGRLVLADFGVAHVQDEDSSLVTRTGALLGTPAFMSPEQAQGDPLDARSDLYSLGATLYRLATGSAPFSGSTPRVVWAIAHGELQPPLRRNPSIGPDLANVIQRMMTVDTADRYQDADAAAKAMTAILHAFDIGDPDEELAEFFNAPAVYEERMKPVVVASTLRLANEAAERRALPRALALADRALALEPDDPTALELVETLGRSRSRAVWWWGVAVVGLVAAGVGGAFALARDDGAGHRVATSAIDGGVESVAVLDASVVTALPRDASIIVPSSRPDARAKTSRVPSVGRRRPDAAPAIVASTPADAAVARALRPDAAPPADASVTLIMTPWCNVTIDGSSYGRADRHRSIKLRPGKHAIVCSQGPGMGQWNKTVRLKPGENRELTGTVHRPVTISVSVGGGDGVRVGKTFHANGTRFKALPSRYRIDVMSKGKLVRGRWITIPRGASCTLRDSPSLGCYR